MKPAHVLGSLLWIAISFAGLSSLTKYKAEPGSQGVASAGWPAGSRLRRDPDRPTLVLFLHPRCPCSRASLEELVAILSRAGHRARVLVALYRPSAEPESWGKTDVWRKAADLPGVTALFDLDGMEARRFGASTSGHAVLYDAGGRLRFSGGITGARGRLGDNPGRRAVIEFLVSGASRGAGAPVFGCPILEDDEVNP